MKRMLYIILLMASAGRLHAQRDVTFELKDVMKEAYDACLLDLVAIHSNQFYPMDSMRSFQVMAGMPVFENGVHKYVYWRYDPLPRVYATVYYDKEANRESARYDGTKREFTAKEAFAFRMVQAVKRNIEADTSFRYLPNAFITINPVIGQNSYHAYLTWKARDDRMAIFGNDYEFEFDENSVLLSKKKNHKAVTYICADGLTDSSPQNRIGFHSHETEALPGFCTTCLLTVYSYSSVLKWKTFYFNDLTDVFCLDLIGGRMRKYTHKEFDKQHEFGLKSVVK